MYCLPPAAPLASAGLHDPFPQGPFSAYFVSFSPVASVGDELLKIVAILSIGMVGTLLFTAQTAGFIRGLVNTPTKEVPKSKKASPYLPSHYLAWGAIVLVSLVATAVSPTGLGPSMSVPFCLGCTVGGYLLGNAVPSSLQVSIVRTHPVMGAA